MTFIHKTWIGVLALSLNMCVKLCKSLKDMFTYVYKKDK